MPDPYIFVKVPAALIDELPTGDSLLLPASSVWSRRGRVGGLIVPPTLGLHNDSVGRVLLQKVRGFPLAPGVQSIDLRRRRDVAEFPLVASVQIVESGTSAAGVLLCRDAGEEHILQAVKVYGSSYRTLSSEGPTAFTDASLRYSRTRLPGGEETLQRIHNSLRRIFVCAFGRGNSMFVTCLCQSLPLDGATVVVADPDRWSGPPELNGHRGLGRGGEPKAHIAARLLSAYGIRVVPVVGRAERTDVIDTLKSSDLALVWPDQDGLNARRILAMATAAWAVPACFLGTRVDDAGDGFVDVSLYVPGGACYLCMANLPDPFEPLPARAGSLMSVNLLAVSLGMALIQDYMARRLNPASQHCRASVRNGAVSVEKTEYAVNERCPVCMMTGGGDLAMTHWTSTG